MLNESERLPRFEGIATEKIEFRHEVASWFSRKDCPASRGLRLET